MPTPYPNAELLVETAWLADRLPRQQRDFRIVDMGPAAQYTRAHITGAVHPGPEDRSHYLKDPADPLHILPPEQFADLMARLGISDGTLVVAYDADGGHTAARLWWALNYYGHSEVKLLDGGWNKWLAEHRPATMATTNFKRGTFTAKPRPELLATVDDLKLALKAGVYPSDDEETTPDRRKASGRDVTILDVRALAEYEATDHRGNKRAGRIPGAKHAEWREFVKADPLMTWRSPEELRALLASRGVPATQEVVTYCQAGVRASHGAFTLALMGYPRIRVYDGSMEEWANRKDTPLENEKPGVSAKPKANRKS